VIFPSLLPKTLTQTLTHLLFHPTTISDRHEPPPLAVGPPHGKEHFNQSGFFKTQLMGSTGNGALDPPFVVSSG